MALGIPLPGSFGDALSKGLATGSDVMQRMVMNPYDMQAKQASAEKDRAEAAKSQMLANMIQSMFGGAGGSSGTGAGGQPSGVGGDVNKRAMAGWLLGLGEFPGDKRAGEVQQTADTERIKTNEKMRSDILDSAYILKNSYKQAQRLQQIFKDRPDLTGPVQGFLFKHDLSTDKDLGKVVTDFGKIQANLAKSSTARPGIGAINWAAKMKASESNPMNINIGKLEETVNDMKEEYDTYRRQYKEATGQMMPSFEEFMGDQPQGQQGGQPQQQPEQPQDMGEPQAPVNEPVPQNTQGSGAPRMAKNLQLPRFNSKEEFQAWFNKQPAFTKHAILLKLKAGQ